MPFNEFALLAASRAASMSEAACDGVARLGLLDLSSLPHDLRPAARGVAAMTGGVAARLAFLRAWPDLARLPGEEDVVTPEGQAALKAVLTAMRRRRPQLYRRKSIRIQCYLSIRHWVTRIRREEAAKWRAPHAGDRLRACRIAKGWTVRNVATALGVSVSYIEQMERGEKPVSGDRIEEIAALFALTPVAFYAGLAAMPPILRRAPRPKRRRRPRVDAWCREAPAADRWAVNAKRRRRKTYAQPTRTPERRAADRARLAAGRKAYHQAEPHAGTAAQWRQRWLKRQAASLD